MKPKAKALRTAPAKKQRKTATKAGQSKLATEARYRIFAEAWLANGGNATDAAKQAGYSPKTARAQGSRLLTKVDIVNLIRSGQDRLARKFELRTEDVLRELTMLAHSDLRELMTYEGEFKPVHLWPAHAAAAVSSIKYGRTGLEVKLWNKPSAIADGMRHLGLFKEDNTQRKDPMTQLMEHIAAHNKGMQVVP